MPNNDNGDSMTSIQLIIKISSMHSIIMWLCLGIVHTNLIQNIDILDI